MEINIYSSVKKRFFSEKKTKEIVEFCLKKLKFDKVEIGIHLVGESRIRSLNRVYRGVDMITDVLSFDTGEGHLGDEGKDLGDIFICPIQVCRQAKIFEVGEKQEFVRMLVHGILHLVGYDHKKKDEAQKMFDLQEKFVKSIL
ncbi:rRNA maturation RNase YbeY [Patescibacteria group bacterium]|nr:rRNA maturation RNase YbeY [Patescibacteria group bacterium]